MTGSVKGHLHNLARAALLGRYPILLQARVQPVSGDWATLQALLSCPQLQPGCLHADVLPKQHFFLTTFLVEYLNLHAYRV